LVDARTASPSLGSPVPSAISLDIPQRVSYGARGARLRLAANTT
jgi:hypothetical protein